MSTQTNTAKADDKPQGVIQQLLKAVENEDGLLPAVQRLAEETIAAWQEQLEQMVHVDVAIKVDRLSVDTARYFLRKALPDGAACLVHAEDWDQPILCAMPRDLVMAFVEAFTGGDGSEEPVKSERDLTAIEYELAGLAFARLTTVLQDCLAPVAPITLSQEKPLGEIDLEAAGLDKCAMVAVAVNVRLASCQSQMLLCIPKAALEMIADSLLAASHDHPRIDERWRGQLDREVRRAPVRICAVLTGGETTLGKVSKLKVGDVLPLNVRTGDLIDVSCNHVPLIRCQLGQSDGLFQLRVEHFINGEQDFLEALLTGSPA